MKRLALASAVAAAFLAGSAQALTYYANWTFNAGFG